MKLGCCSCCCCWCRFGMGSMFYACSRRPNNVHMHHVEYGEWDSMCIQTQRYEYKCILYLIVVIPSKMLYSCECINTSLLANMYHIRIHFGRCTYSFFLFYLFSLYTVVHARYIWYNVVCVCIYICICMRCILIVRFVRFWVFSGCVIPNNSDSLLIKICFYLNSQQFSLSLSLSLFFLFFYSLANVVPFQLKLDNGHEILDEFWKVGSWQRWK